ncbi:MAG: hypothetical protein HDQ91_06275 [Desulfovibrio sp.]|nr:hypothetical protein [Desulfovibrio sp.]
MGKLYKPDKMELEALRREATQDGKVSEAEWVKKNIELTAGILRRDPLRYRSYGPYWWIVKQSMISHGLDEFGDFVDREWFEQADYGSEFYNLLAGLLYSNAAMDAGLIYSNAHIIHFEPEDPESEHDVFEYVVADDRMESLAIQDTIK